MAKKAWVRRRRRAAPRGGGGGGGAMRVRQCLPRCAARFCRWLDQAWRVYMFGRSGLTTNTLTSQGDKMTRTMQQLFDLTGKTALVTGGSRGLGLQRAHALGEAGAKIMLSSRKAPDLEEAVAELQAAGIDARWIVADCAREEDIRRLADETLERVGAVDILVNNAGAAWGAPAEDHPEIGRDKVMDLNVRGYFILSQHMAKHCMIGRRSGSIINVASIAGLGGNSKGMHTI